MNKIYSILNSLQADSVQINVEKVEGLLKSWGANIKSANNAQEDVASIKKENGDLKRSLKELKASFISNVPNPSEDDLKKQVSIWLTKGRRINEQFDRGTVAS